MAVIQLEINLYCLDFLPGYQFLFLELLKRRSQFQKLLHQYIILLPLSKNKWRTSSAHGGWESILTGKTDYFEITTQITSCIHIWTVQRKYHYFNRFYSNPFNSPNVEVVDYCFSKHLPVHIILVLHR